MVKVARGASRASSASTIDRPRPRPRYSGQHLDPLQGTLPNITVEVGDAQANGDILGFINDPQPQFRLEDRLPGPAQDRGQGGLQIAVESADQISMRRQVQRVVGLLRRIENHWRLCNPASISSPCMEYHLQTNTDTGSLNRSLKAFTCLKFKSRFPFNISDTTP